MLAFDLLHLVPNDILTVLGFQCSMAYDRESNSRNDSYFKLMNVDNVVYYIPITDTTLELSVFWPSDTESRINELRFSESISLSFKTRLTLVTCFCGNVT